MYIEISPSLRLRPKHLLLMMYRYLSGVYQLGDLSALNYVKGFLDGQASQFEVKRILTVCGHGIGEPERWLSERMVGCQIDTVSFRLLDTQLFHFLRAARRRDIEKVFSKFRKIVAPYKVISELVSDPGLIPYWCEQAEKMTGLYQQGRVTVFGDYPLRIPETNSYDLIYVSHGARYFSVEAAMKLRQRLSQQGWLAILTPTEESCSDDRSRTDGRFVYSAPVREAKALFRKLLKDRGYILTPAHMRYHGLSALTSRRERIRFNVLASAVAVLIGELILSSLSEHISERARLEALNETASRFTDLSASVNEELDLYLMGKEES